MEVPKNDRLLLSFVCILSALFVALVITVSIVNMTKAYSIFFISCLFLFSVGILIYTHCHEKYFLDETLTSLIEVFSSGIEHIETISVLGTTPLITPYGRTDVWSGQPVSLRNTGIGTALNISLLFTDGERCCISKNNSILATNEKNKITLFSTPLVSSFPDTIDDLSVLVRDETRALVFYQDVLGIPYLAVYGAKSSGWVFIGVIRKTTAAQEEFCMAIK